MADLRVGQRIYPDALCFIMETRKRVSRSALRRRLGRPPTLANWFTWNLETNRPEQKRNPGTDG